MYKLIIEILEEFKTDLLENPPEFFIDKSQKPSIKQTSISGRPHLLKYLTEEQSSAHIDFLPAQRSRKICILASPLQIKDFTHYLHSQPSEFIQECVEALISVLTIFTPGFSTIVLEFSSQIEADNFFLVFNGHEFEDLSNEYCYALFISDLQISSSYKPIREWRELPLCPLCIERLDIGSSGVSGVIRTEGDDLSKSRWKGAIENCRVCETLNKSSEDFTCPDCGGQEEIWVCLICGSIGCGRYKEAHSKEHYLNTNHSYTVEISSQCIWDYDLDNYVHRILYSGRGVMVLDSQFTRDHKENIERVVNEYNHLISSQLEKQRQAYEQKIENILSAKNSFLTESVKNSKSENDYLKRKLSKLKVQKKKGGKS